MQDCCQSQARSWGICGLFLLGLSGVSRAEELVIPPPPPVAELQYVDIEVETPEVAFVLIDGTVHSRHGKQRRVRLIRHHARLTSIITANWSEAGQDRRIDRVVDLRHPARIVFSLDDLTSSEQQLFDLTNQSRANVGLPMLRLDPSLCRAARQHSFNMARFNSMSHQLQGRTHQHRVREAGYHSGFVAENISASQRDPESAIRTWLNSSGHRANMLSSQYVDLGVGIGYSSSGQPYYTQVFGR